MNPRMTRRDQNTRGSTTHYTDLFHRARVDSWPQGDFRKRGDASTAVDRDIGRVVVRLAGSVPASNSLRLPRRQEDTLGASGRFLYVQLRLQVGKPYAIHADVTAADRGLHRISVSNLYASQAAVRMKRSGVQVFMPAAHDRWMLLALDLSALTRQASSSAYAKLRALHLCANMTVRGAFTSDVRYDWQFLPTDLSFTTAFDLAHAHVLWVPEEPLAAVAAAPKRRPCSPHPPLPGRPPLRSRREGRIADTSTGTAGQPQSEQLLPAPIACLEHVSAFSGSRSPGLLHWVPGSGAAGAQEVVFASGSLIIGMQPGSGQQRHLRGHEGLVCAMALAADGARLASAEEGPGAALRLWDYQGGRCLATVPGHAGGTLCLDLSPDGTLLATVGVDAAGRQALVCWDVSACWAAADGCGGSCGGRAVELARHISEYNVQAVKFVPYSPDTLVTCGKNSIRSYRLRAGQLRGVSVPMDGVQALRRPYSCGTLATASAAVGEVFTCLSFEHRLGVRPLEARRLYVGSLSGALYIVNLEGRAVEGVAQLHSGALAALAVHNGFCVTGSADRLLRVWGSDLQQVYLEAQHEGPVTGVGLSPDGQWAVVGTQGGTLSLLDIASQTYSSLMRSHTAAVHAVALMEGGGGTTQYVTAGADGTVRVWDVDSHQQVSELVFPGQVVLSVACHPSSPEVACGFEGGLVRVFNCSSAALVQESRQHCGPVTRLTYARHGRLLLSLGEDGCVCVHDAQRTYLPTAYIQAGFPLHATAMAASKDGRLLAVSSLVKRSTSKDGQGRPSTGQSGSSGWQAKGSSGTAQQPGITLFDLVTMQPVLQLPVAGRSRVVQLELTPDESQLLAVTADGRLLGYKCCDGALVLEVPLCHSGSCSTLALDPTSSFLVSASQPGQLRILGLQQLHNLSDSAHPAAADVIRCLPSQELSNPAGSAVTCATFAAGGATGLQLLTVGGGGEVCCWSFSGRPDSAREATGQAVEAPITTRFQQTVQLVADCTSAAPHAPPALTCQSGAGLMQPSSSPPLQLVPDAEASVVEQPAPRSLPAALQHLPARPPSAQAAPCKQVAADAACTTAGGCVKPHGTTSLPGSPARVRHKQAPLFWGPAEEIAEAALIISATDTHRCTQVVRQHKQLRVTSPYKIPGLSAAKQPQRSAAWVDAEVAGDRVPPYHPSQQLRLLPPSATVRHVHGFDAGAGFCFVQPTESLGQQQQQLVYAAGNILLERTQSGQQRHLARLPRNISALAVHGSLAAVAVEPVCGDGSTAEVHLVDICSGVVRAVLSHHSYTVQRMHFSHNGSLLAALSSDCGSTSSSPGTSLALWSVDRQSSVLVAAVQLPEAVADLTWSPDTGSPSFYTASSRGLTQWRLEPDTLGGTVVHMPAALRGAVLSAAACVAPAAVDGSASRRDSNWWFKEQATAVFVGDSCGRIWKLAVDDGQDGRGAVLLAELPGQAVSCMTAAGSLCAVGTADGSLLLLAEEGGAGGKAASWRVASREQLDGPLVSLQLDASGRSVAAATASGTLWQVGRGDPPGAVLCGQQHQVQGWHLAPGATWKGAGPTAALASAAGLAIWQLGAQEGGKGESWAAAPLVEFCVPVGATHASLASDASCCAAAYQHGSVCLFDAAAASMRWKVAVPAAQCGAVVGLAVVQRLQGLKVMVATRGGAVFVLDGGTGKVAHRSMQFAAMQDSGRRCPANFPLAGLAVCPADSAVFVLCGEQGLVVCRSAWSKNAAVHTLARLNFAAPDAASPGAPPGAAVQVAFSCRHPGHLYCTNPTEPGQLLLFDYSRISVIKTLLVPLAGSTAITALALHPTEELLAVGTASGSVLLLRLETEAWSELSAHGGNDAVVGLAFSACGGRLFTAAGTAAFEWCVEQA